MKSHIRLIVRPFWTVWGEFFGPFQYPSGYPFRSKPGSLKHVVSGPLGICSISNLMVVPPGAKNGVQMGVQWLHERDWIVPYQVSSQLWGVEGVTSLVRQALKRSGVGFILPVAYSLTCDPVFSLSGFTTWQRIQFCSMFTRRGQYE